MRSQIFSHIRQISPHQWSGYVSSVVGLNIEVSGFGAISSVGSRCFIYPRQGTPIVGEVVGFKGESTLVMPYQFVSGIGPGCIVSLLSQSSNIYPSFGWLGRVINGLAQAVDGGPPLDLGEEPYSIHPLPPPATSRQRLGPPLELGIRTINLFTTCCLGQRMGIFAGSGVGKSVLLSMMSRFSQADVNVIGLIGERGREVKEFITDYLGEEGLKRSVVIVATSDEAPLMRRQAAYLTLAVAEYFSQQGQEVLCTLDSLTRFAMAQREIGLSLGEPPATKGYTPTVFAELPRLLERAGPGTASTGSITGLFTVLVDGDDHNEPIADAARGILDGHIVLDRKIAEQGRFPAINILKSLSRSAPDCQSLEHRGIVKRARRIISVYEDMVDMIRLGAYQNGSNAEVDLAIKIVPKIYEFLSQNKDEYGNLSGDIETLNQILEEYDG